MKRRILIVDDDASIRESMKKILEAANYEVLQATDAIEAAARFGPGLVDLVLLDLNLPGPSGWEVFASLSSRDPLTPIVIITGLPDQFPTARMAGVGALVEKPIEVPALLAVMAQLIAEPKERLLGRLCGLRDDTRLLPQSGTSLLEQTRRGARLLRRGQPWRQASRARL